MFVQDEHMNCKHCSSKYTEFRSETAELGKTTRTYYCQSCKQTFTDDTLQAPADGEWLMTFRRALPQNQFSAIMLLLKSTETTADRLKSIGRTATQVPLSSAAPG